MKRFFNFMQPMLAADGAAGGGDPAGSAENVEQSAAAAKEETGTESEKAESLSFEDAVAKNPEYEAALAKQITDAVAKAKQDAAESAAKQAELEKLPEDQKAAALLQAEKDRADKLQAEKDAILLRQDAAAMLAEKKLPAGMADMVVGADKEATAANVAQLEAAFNASVAAAVAEKLPGYTPQAGKAQAGANSLMRAAMGLPTSEK